MSLYAGLSLREVYEKRCRHFRVPANSGLQKLLPELPDVFHTLKKLDLSANFIGCKGFLPLVEVIRCCRNLQHIDLSGQQLDKPTLEILCAVLRRHPSIRSLNLSSNPITIVGGAIILELVKDNRAIVSVNLDDTNVKQTMMDLIMQQLQYNLEAKSAASKPAPAITTAAQMTVSGDENCSGVAAPTTTGDTAAGGMPPAAAVEKTADQLPRINRRELRPTVEETVAMLRRVPSSTHPILFDENPLPEIERWLTQRRCKFFDPQFPAGDGDTSVRETVTGDMIRGVPSDAQRVATGRYGISSWLRVSELFKNPSLLPGTSAAPALEHDAAADGAAPSLKDARPQREQSEAEEIALPTPCLGGFSWLFGTLNALVDRRSDARGEAMLSDLFCFGGVTRLPNDVGAYVVRVFVDGAWRFVVVDDFLPVDRYGELMFAKPIYGATAVLSRDAAQDASGIGSGTAGSAAGSAATSVKINCDSEGIAVWPCILEKALAKMYGGYEWLDTTYVPENVAKTGATTPPALRLPPCARTMADLTGGVGLVRSLSLAAEEAVLSDEETTSWSTLMEVLSKAALESAATNGVTRAVAVSKTEQALSGLGGIPGYRRQLAGIAPDYEAYELLQVRQVNGHRLVQLRHRLTNVQWKGEWCAQSMAWRQYPDVDRELNGGGQRNAAVPMKKSKATIPTATDPFWMSYRDFLLYFYEVHLCRVFVTSHAAEAQFSGTHDEDTGDRVWHERLLRGCWSPDMQPGRFDQCHEWYRNPHFRLHMYGRGAVFVNVCVKDARFACQSPVTEEGTAVAKASAKAKDAPLLVAFHLLQTERYPIRGVEPAVNPANPSAPLSEGYLESTCLFGTRYAATDSLTFEGILEETDDTMPYWIIPSRAHDCESSTATADADGSTAATPFYVRAFSSAPFQLSVEHLASHWNEEVLETEVLSSGELLSGENNPQVAMRIGGHASGSAGPLFGIRGGDGGSDVTEQSRLRRSTANTGVGGGMGSALVSPLAAEFESCSGPFTNFPRGIGHRASREQYNGTLIVKASLVKKSGLAADTLAGVAPTRREGPHAVSRGQRALALYMTEGEVNFRGEPTRLIGPVETGELVAQSLYLLDDAVYIELSNTVTAGELYNLLCCVQPPGTRATVRFTIWSTLPISQATLLPPWPTKELRVSWPRSTGSGAFYEASGHPQIEVYPVLPLETLVVRLHMERDSTSIDDPTIMLTVVSNAGRCGEGLLGRIPSERILVRSEYVTGSWVQCEVSVGETGMDSLLIIPCLQPARSQGACVVSVASQSARFSIREVRTGTT